MYQNFAKNVEKKDPLRSAELLALSKASWTGTYGYRALVDTEKLLKRYPNHQAAFNAMLVSS